MADDLPKVTQKLTKSKTKFMQVSVVCIKITVPSKGTDNEQCDLGITTATYIEVSSPRGTVTKMISKQWVKVSGSLMNDTPDGRQSPHCTLHIHGGHCVFDSTRESFHQL